MPRNRMIKPEFWDDEKLIEISRDARLVFIALWNFSDDYGVVKAHPIWLKNHIFPYDETLEIDTFKTWLDQIEKIGAIIPFSSNGENLYFISNFNKHQRINRPSAQRNPEPPDNIQDDYKAAHGGLTASSLPKRKEVKRKEVKRKERTPAASSVSLPKSNSYEEKVGSFFDTIFVSCCTIAKYPQKQGKPFNPHQWVQEKCNKGYHPGAIDEVMAALAKPKNWTGIEIHPYGYANAILKTKAQNWNEKEAVAIHEAMKKWDPKEFADLTRNILKAM